MAGYIEMEATKRDREAYEAMDALLRIIVNRVSKADFVATIFDHELGSSTAETIVVPDEVQFDLVQEALRGFDLAHWSSSELRATNDLPLVRLVCYRNGRPNERAVDADEFSLEHFNPRPDNSSRMIHRTESAVRLTHRSTGIVVVSDGARSRHGNFEQALRMLSAKLANNAAPLLLSARSIKAFQHSLGS